jgi:hypothetical protein
MSTTNVRFELRRDTKANWDLNANVILLSGEPGVELLPNGSSNLKIGNGFTTWRNLPYANATTGTISMGPTGLNGVDGATGHTGPSGLNGLDGPTGPTGPSGLNGAAGPTGLQGPTGLNGGLGPTGPSGLNGGLGPTGPSGLNGVDGLTGLQGPTGPMGLSSNLVYSQRNIVSTSSNLLDPTTYTTYSLLNERPGMFMAFLNLDKDDPGFATSPIFSLISWDGTSATGQARTKAGGTALIITCYADPGGKGISCKYSSNYPTDPDLPTATFTIIRLS